MTWNVYPCSFLCRYCVVGMCTHAHMWQAGRQAQVSCLRHHLPFIRDSLSVAFPVPGRVLSWLDKEPRDLSVSSYPELRLPLYTTLPGSFNVSSGQVLYFLSSFASILNTFFQRQTHSNGKFLGNIFNTLRKIITNHKQSARVYCQGILHQTSSWRCVGLRVDRILVFQAGGYIGNKSLTGVSHWETWAAKREWIWYKAELSRSLILS